jgi:hypothetical protein
MPGTDFRDPMCRRASIAAALALVLLGAGCAGTGVMPDAATGASSGRSGSGSIGDFFSGFSAKSPQTVAGAQPDLNCPTVDVRQGASTLNIGPTGDKTAMTTKYQGTFMREARNCAVVNGNMMMTIGIEGRVVVGPAGTPGPVDIPLRIAVVQETPGSPKMIVTKFIRIPVTIGPNEENATFTHIEQGLSFPVPTPTYALDDYIAYIGFDPLTMEAQNKQAQKPAVKPKSKPKPAVSSN